MRYRTALLQFGTGDVQSATDAIQFDWAAQLSRNSSSRVLDWRPAVVDRSNPVQSRSTECEREKHAAGDSVIATERCDG
jgi:hypothetical protein